MVRRLLLLAAVVVGWVPAAAHMERPGERVVLDRVQPALPEGVSVQVAESAATQLVVENTTATPFVVLGPGGRPFLRISAAGVEADVASVDFIRSNHPEGVAVAPGSDEPDFRVVTTEPAWGWFDHRLHSDRWTVGATYGDTQVAISGRRVTTPVAGTWVTTVKRQPPGLAVSVAAGKFPAVLARLTDAADEAEVEGAGGEPMIRLSRSRGSEVNDASETWAITGRGRPGFAFDRPGWRTVSAQPSQTWLEPRLRPPATGDGTVTWSLPVTVDGRPTSVEGEHRFVPAGGDEDDDGMPAWLLAVPVLTAASVVGGRSLARTWRATRGTSPARASASASPAAR